MSIITTPDLLIKQWYYHDLENGNFLIKPRSSYESLIIVCVRHTYHSYYGKDEYANLHLINGRDSTNLEFDEKKLIIDKSPNVEFLEYVCNAILNE